jgi:hypothetical protein
MGSLKPMDHTNTPLLYVIFVKYAFFAKYAIKERVYPQREGPFLIFEYAENVKYAKYALYAVFWSMCRTQCSEN